MRIFLVGPMGSGKSTLGVALAERLQLPFIDLDRVIEAREGLTISALFQEKGEAYFRQCESDELQTIIQTTQAAVIATGGGTPCFHDNMKLMNAAGVTFYLHCSIETLQHRIEGTSDERPVLRQAGFSIENLLTEREIFYAKAKHTVSNGGAISTAVDAMISLLKSP